MSWNVVLKMVGIMFFIGTNSGLSYFMTAIWQVSNSVQEIAPTLETFRHYFHSNICAGFALLAQVCTLSWRELLVTHCSKWEKA